jgi:hypothetical protein
MTLNSDAPAQLCPTTVEKTARKRLAKTGYRSLGLVHCQFDDGTLTLHGRVPSYYHKQVAQEVIRNVADVETIVNEINVWS